MEVSEPRPQSNRRCVGRSGKACEAYKPDSVPEVLSGGMDQTFLQLIVRRHPKHLSQVQQKRQKNEAEINHSAVILTFHTLVIQK